MVVVPVLVLLLGLLGTNLWRELRELSTAETDNLQWTILQIETEVANLGTTLAEAAANEAPDTNAVRLRADIALSRLLIVGRGEARDLFPEDSAPLWERVNAYQDNLIEILDADPDLSRVDIIAMRDLTRDIRPDMRELVLLGLEVGAQRAEMRRAGFALQLVLTGAIAIAVILGLSGVLVALDRLLVRAGERDAELLASSARLGSTIEASLDAIVTANEAGEIIEFNTSAERIFGWSRKEILGRKMDDTIIPHQHRSAHATGMNRYLATREAHVVDAGRVELSASRKSGEEFPVELNITSVQSADGELFIAYLRDISVRKINEQKLIDARDRALSMDRAKSQFLAVMSHEMRTPLNGILGVLDLMRQTKLSKQQDRYARVASASGEILLEHVNEALDITRIEMGSMQLSSHPFEIRRTVEGITDVLTPLAQEKGLSLQLEFDPGMDLTFDGDGGRIGQILTNLIGNAIKFTQQGRITVAVVGADGPQLRFETPMAAESRAGTDQAIIHRAGPAAPLILSGLPAYQGAVFHMPIDARPTSGYLQIDATSQVLDGVEGVLRISIDNTRRAEVLLHPGEAVRSVRIELTPADIARAQLVVSFSLLGTGANPVCTSDQAIEALVEIETTSALFVTLDGPLETPRDRIAVWGDQLRLLWDGDARGLLHAVGTTRTGTSVLFVSEDGLSMDDAETALTTLRSDAPPETGEFAWSEAMADDGGLYGLRRFQRSHTWRLRYDLATAQSANLPDVLELSMIVPAHPMGGEWQVTITHDNRLLARFAGGSDQTRLSERVTIPRRPGLAHTIDITVTSAVQPAGLCNDGPELLAEILSETQIIPSDTLAHDPIRTLTAALAQQSFVAITVADDLNAVEAHVATMLLVGLLPRDHAAIASDTAPAITVMPRGTRLSDHPEDGLWVVYQDADGGLITEPASAYGGREVAAVALLVDVSEGAS